MNAVASTLERLRELGYEIALESPDGIRYRYQGEGEAPEEAVPLLEELRAWKPEALALLVDVEWEETRERERLDAAYDAADTAACTVPSWADAWTWARSERLDLVDAVDVALDAIDAAFRTKDTVANARACRALVEAVRAVASAYKETT